MRNRDKQCQACIINYDALYRCRYGGESTWYFLCENCLIKIKNKYQDSYQYGGTWKAMKKK
ncbi:MAG: hypothetical protein EBW64_06210 [Betaproteobacteria bacterium]|nr:hypothetical protein [Betaproteobacteria bacterium]